MKIRNGFVTNSSSSSYIVTYKIDSRFDNIKDVIKEEFGNYGLDIIEHGLLSGSDIIRKIRESLEDEPDVLEKINLFLNDSLSDEDEEGLDDFDFEIEIGDVYLYGSTLMDLLRQAKSEPEAMYIVGSRVSYTNEGATDSSSMFIIDVICPACNIDYSVVTEESAY